MLCGALMSETSVALAQKHILNGMGVRHGHSYLVQDLS